MKLHNKLIEVKKLVDDRIDDNRRFYSAQWLNPGPNSITDYVEKYERINGPIWRDLNKALAMIQNDSLGELFLLSGNKTLFSRYFGFEEYDFLYDILRASSQERIVNLLDGRLGWSKNKDRLTPDKLERKIHKTYECSSKNDGLVFPASTEEITGVLDTVGDAKLSNYAILRYAEMRQKYDELYNEDYDSKIDRILKKEAEGLIDVSVLETDDFEQIDYIRVQAPEIGIDIALPIDKPKKLVKERNDKELS